MSAASLPNAWTGGVPAPTPLTKSPARRERLSKAYAKANGYRGYPGGWIYCEGSRRPVCQGWAVFYHLKWRSIDAWAREAAPRVVANVEHDDAREAVVCWLCGLGWAVRARRAS